MTNQITLDITQRDGFADGHTFDETGAYERVKGRVQFAVDPTAPAQATIVDIDKAPRNGDGLVEFAADFLLIKPSDMACGNDRLFFDYGNRGNARCLQFFNDAAGSNDPRDLAAAGNGFFMRRGYTLAWIGWQADLLPGGDRFLLDVPVASNGDVPITGPVRVEYIADQAGITTFPLSSRATTRSHPTASLDTQTASLTRRRYPEDARIPLSADSWMFARLETGTGLDAAGTEVALVPSDQHIHIPAGFAPGWIYELVYEGRDPLVLGLGHICVRDFISFLKHDAKDAAGNANPLLNDGRPVAKAYGWGRSQTGRCIRDFVYHGFNADAQNRRVFDGILPHVAGAGRMWMNHRFANVIVSAGQQYEDHYNPADRFPFSYAQSTDHLTGKTDAILKRPETDPLVLHTQTATEYWQRRGSLVHTDTQGNDLAQPDTVRVYFWASSQHFADPRLGKQTSTGVCQNIANVVWTSMLFRAMLDAMDAWASEGRPPPDSRIPLRADTTLVSTEDWHAQFPSIPGVMPPKEPNQLPLLDFGADVEQGILAEPPEIVAGKTYAVLVPAVDADGNDIAGVRAPMVSAPLATYTGWNPRRRGFGHGALYDFSGSTLPFAVTAEEQQQTGDPRPSIAERYGHSESYIAAIERAARDLVDAGLMLAEDVPRCVAAAQNWHAPRHDVDLP